MKKLRKIFAAIGITCFLIIMGYSILIDGWFTSKMPDFIRWSIAAGVIVGGLGIGFIRNIVTLLSFLGGIVFIVVGLFTTGTSFYYWQTDKDASSTAIHQELSSLEAGKELANMHLNIGKSIWMRHQGFSLGDTKNGRKVIKKVYFPTISYSNFSDSIPVDMIKNNKRFSKAERNRHIGQAINKPDSFAVLVELDIYGNDDLVLLSTKPEFRDTTEGMVWRTADQLKPSVRAHYKKIYPDLNLSKVFVLSVYKKPRKFDLFNVYSLFGGLALIGFGYFLHYAEKFIDPDTIKENQTGENEADSEIVSK